MRILRSVVVAAGVCGLGAGAAGCGSSRPPLSAPASQQLQAQVAALREAAVGSDPARAAADLSRLRAEVVQLRQQGQISSSRAGSILTAASAVAGQLDGIPTTTTSTSSTTSTSTTSTSTSTTSTTTVAPPPKPGPGPGPGGHSKPGHHD